MAVEVNLVLRLEGDDLKVYGPDGGAAGDIDVENATWISCVSESPTIHRWVLGMKHDRVTPFDKGVRLLSASGSQKDRERIAKDAEGEYEFFVLAYGAACAWHVDPKLIIRNQSGGSGIRELRSIQVGAEMLLDTMAAADEEAVALDAAFRAARERFDIARYADMASDIAGRIDETHERVAELEREFAAFVEAQLPPSSSPEQ